MAYTLETYQLPSNGKLEGVPKEVTIRNMTTAEEKMLLGSAEDVFDQIIKKCVVKPEDFDISKIPIMDKNFLYIRIRVISYGQDYKFSFRCPECGAMSTTTINLDDAVEVNYLPDDYTEPFDTFELPVCGDTVSLKLPRNEDFTKMKARVRRYNNKFPDAVGDQTWIYGLMAFISQINGKDVDAKLQSYVEGLHVKDASYIRHRVNKLDAGVSDTVVVHCNKCGEDVEVAIPTGVNFFHTDFDD